MYFNMPTRLFMGENIIAEHQEEFRTLGHKCLIVTGKSAAKKSGALDDVTNALQSCKIEWKLYDEIGQNPYLSSCYRGGQLAAEFGADFIIGIGGGSPLDAAKAVAFFGAHPEAEPMELYKIGGRNLLPIVLVGTTAGTASEITRFSVITVDETGEKCSWNSPDSYAKISFGDYRYTSSLPYYFTISTALDTFSHATEAYFSKNSDEFSDIMAIEALKLLVPVLEELKDCNVTITQKQREKLYRASIYAGFPLNRCGMNICHKMSYYLTEKCGVPHGNACGLFQPTLLEHVEECVPQKCCAYYNGIGRTKQQVLDLLRTLVVTDYEPVSDIEIEGLLTKWKDAPHMRAVVGDFDQNKQRMAATRVMQQKKL